MPNSSDHLAAAIIASLPVLDSGFTPFDAKVHTQLAFGKIPARHRYELFYERYRSAAEIISANLPARPVAKAISALSR